jgi:lipopolysaccharide transport system ATP-binding protein
MKNLAIKAENISKQYRLGEVGTGTLSHDLNRFWHKVRGLEDPYLKIGEANDRSSKGESDYVWSLRDINFEIEQGDAVGIIGRNGAGKSTLLKLLSKVTKPTTGSFKVNGRIASLLEVGTGFNPEMTGRENIYLNGAILGMRRYEITRKLDEIIAFSGVERYIDTPVKRYSSGMYVRLAFAVAAHLESEILIVDEVLAVGDAEFQKKCLGKMKDVSSNDGRTILFVSHNMGSLSSLCQSGILLQNGLIIADGKIDKVLGEYAASNINKLKSLDMLKFDGPLSQYLKITNININGNNPFSEYINIAPYENIDIKINIYSDVIHPIRILISIFRESNRLFTIHDEEEHQHVQGNFISKFSLPSYLLKQGIYTIAIGAHSLKDEWLWNDSVFDFEITDVYDELNDRRDYGMINLKKLSRNERIK